MAIELSIVVATCNRPNYIASFLAQFDKLGLLSRENYETLIIENHTDKNVIDATRAICSEYKVSFISAPGHGRPHALNIGTENAKGAYIAFTDDDCLIYDLDWAEKLKAAIVTNPRLGYVAGRVVSVKTENMYQNLWEDKGGLSKGDAIKYWSINYLKSPKYKVFPWPFHKICAGLIS